MTEAWRLLAWRLLAATHFLPLSSLPSDLIIQPESRRQPLRLLDAQTKSGQWHAIIGPAASAASQQC